MGIILRNAGKHRKPWILQSSMLFVLLVGVATCCWIFIGIPRRHGLCPRAQQPAPAFLGRGWHQLVLPSAAGDASTKQPEAAAVLQPGSRILFVVRHQKAWCANGEDLDFSVSANETESPVKLFPKLASRSNQETFILCGFPDPKSIHDNYLTSNHNLRASISCGQTSLKSSVAKWDNVVYAATPQPDGLYVWAKGRFFSPKLLPDSRCMVTCHGRCSGSQNRSTFAALTCGQEVVVCPPAILAHCSNIVGFHEVSLKAAGTHLPSAARVFSQRADSPQRSSESGEHSRDLALLTRKPLFLCACTMVFNSGKFLTEWILYHKRLGVQHFFIYDNNSEDDTAEVVERLVTHGASVSRHVWPWEKSQQGAFSSCVIRARNLCKWLILTDVDEFLYPAKLIRQRDNLWNQAASLAFRSWSSWFREHGTDQSDSDEPLLHQLVRIESLQQEMKYQQKNRSGRYRKFKCSQVGQIQVPCLVFGPSGLLKHPSVGLTAGYTCRLEAPDRHKTIIHLDAVDPPFLNVVHHFVGLKHGFCSISLGRSVVAIFHYKYQVWDEFKSKFQKRAASYVPNWQEDKSLQSQDRVSGLGTSAIKPEDWEDRFCELEDIRLREFVVREFTVKHSAQDLEWQSVMRDRPANLPTERQPLSWAESELVGVHKANE